MPALADGESRLGVLARSRGLCYARRRSTETGTVVPTRSRVGTETRRRLEGTEPASRGIVLERQTDMSDIAERVKKIVVEHLGVDEAKVTENASFVDDLGADSLDTVELVMAFEEEFGCEIPDDAAEKIATVKDAIAFIESHK